MTELEKFDRNATPTLEVFSVWMINAGPKLAENHYQFVLGKVQSGDTWWQDYLDIAAEIMWKRFWGLTVRKACQFCQTVCDL